MALLEPISSVLNIGAGIGSGTAKSVLFLDTGGVLAQDNTNFQFDIATHQLTLAKPLIISQATGTSPLTISSTTVVGNLNADMVDGLHVVTTGSGLGNMAVVNNWTRPQRSAQTVLTLSAGTFTWDWNATGPNYEIQGASGATIAVPLPSNPAAGMNITLVIKQSATGGEYGTFASSSYKLDASVAGVAGNANGFIKYEIYYDGTRYLVSASDY